MIQATPPINTPENAIDTLKTHGKTFNTARYFLSPQTGHDAAVLYQFCRTIDDIADGDMPTQSARVELEKIITAINTYQTTHPVAGPFLGLVHKHNIATIYGIHLIQGVMRDLTPVEFTSLEELIQYSYQVAGTVGLMMAPILGANEKGYAFAIDLGIGMQLTNIARDVLEDAEMGRRYIPGEWVNHLSPAEIYASTPEAKTVIPEAIHKMLRIADEYYQSGFDGLRYLHGRNRLSIGLAGTLYKQIGIQLERNNCEYWRGRTVISRSNKLGLSVKYLISQIVTPTPEYFPNLKHDKRLHRFLTHFLSELP